MHSTGCSVFNIFSELCIQGNTRLMDSTSAHSTVMQRDAKIRDINIGQAGLDLVMFCQMWLDLVRFCQMWVQQFYINIGQGRFLTSLAFASSASSTSGLGNLTNMGQAGHCRTFLWSGQMWLDLVGCGCNSFTGSSTPFHRLSPSFPDGSAHVHVHVHVCPRPCSFTFHRNPTEHPSIPSLHIWIRAGWSKHVVQE